MLHKPVAFSPPIFLLHFPSSLLPFPDFATTMSLHQACIACLTFFWYYGILFCFSSRIPT
jgi:hypothetical protein